MLNKTKGRSRVNRERPVKQRREKNDQVGERDFFIIILKKKERRMIKAVSIEIRVTQSAGRRTSVLFLDC